MSKIDPFSCRKRKFAHRILNDNRIWFCRYLSLIRTIQLFLSIPDSFFRLIEQSYSSLILLFDYRSKNQHRQKRIKMIIEFFDQQDLWEHDVLINDDEKMFRLFSFFFSSESQWVGKAEEKRKRREKRRKEKRCYFPIFRWSHSKFDKLNLYTFFFSNKFQYESYVNVRCSLCSSWSTFCSFTTD